MDRVPAPRNATGSGAICIDPASSLKIVSAWLTPTDWIGTRGLDPQPWRPIRAEFARMRSKLSASCCRACIRARSTAEFQTRQRRLHTSGRSRGRRFRLIVAVGIFHGGRIGVRGFVITVADAIVRRLDIAGGGRRRRAHSGDDHDSFLFICSPKLMQQSLQSY